MKSIRINGRLIGPNRPVYIVAELSGNHNQDYSKAERLVRVAADAGADAVKLQTYTADTLTIDCRTEPFRIHGTVWDGKTLYDLYKEAYTPWEWQPKLKKLAGELGLDLFSTPFDETAVDFLEEMSVPAYKIASFEIIDTPLIRRMARTGKPMILSTGMASRDEIAEAVRVVREEGNDQIVLLKCTSAYPAPPEDLNLRTIPVLAETFNTPAGLSDHTLGITAPVTAASLGACLIEKHFTLSRSEPGPDSAFSLEPAEFRSMVEAVRTAEKALGEVKFGTTLNESGSLAFRRSLFAVQDIRKGERLTRRNVRCIRPGYGLHPRHLEDVLDQRARCDIKRGTPLSWGQIETAVPDQTDQVVTVDELES